MLEGPIEWLVRAGLVHRIPIEVKAGVNTKAISMQVYRDKYVPPNAVLFSGQGSNQLDHGLLHAPLYLAGAQRFTVLRGH